MCDLGVGQSVCVYGSDLESSTVSLRLEVGKGKEPPVPAIEWTIRLP